MVDLVLKLSPSSARDFKSCPQLFKYRSIDKLPEPTSPAAARGSLVHAVLERLFTEPATTRTPERAQELLAELWEQLREDPELRPEGMEMGAEDEWLKQSRKLIRNYFALEDPRHIEATKLEWWIDVELTDVHLRGIIDRLDIDEDGSWILSDYKTGPIPGQTHEYGAFFGLRFYALVCWRALSVMPKEIRLIYLSDPAMLIFNPTEKMLVAFEQQMHALAKAIRRAMAKEDWRTRPSPYCMACSFQSICPAWEQATAERPQRDDLI